MEFFWIAVALVAATFSYFIGLRSGKRAVVLQPSDTVPEVVIASQQEVVENRSTKNTAGVKLATKSLSPNPDYAATILALTSNEKPDTKVSTVSVASTRGVSHIESGLPRQDNYCILTKSNETLIVLSDGTSSAEESHLGSLFLVQNFERIYDEIFPDGNSPDPLKWKELNLKLSQNLVAMFVSRSKQKGEKVPESVTDLRLAAAAKYASTLEVLVVSKKIEGEPLEYIFVRVAGDGGVFHVDDVITQIFVDETGLNLKDASVRVLPISDSIPVVFSGQIMPGENLMVATDGIGDFILSNDKWRNALLNYCQMPQPSSVDLLELVNFFDPNSRDDRTLAIVSNAK